MSDRIVLPTNPLFKNLTGQRFSRLLVLSYAGYRKGTSWWNCRCDCGTEKAVRVSLLIRGVTKSCGCLVSEVTARRNRIHSQSHTRLFRIWANMLNRCFNEATPSYKYYGARGITVCKEWRFEFTPFRDWALANGYDASLSIDRIDNDGNYESSNCRWATALTQGGNKRGLVSVTAFGETKNLSQWAADPRCPVTRGAIMKRLASGMAPEQAITTPVATPPPRKLIKCACGCGGELTDLDPKGRPRRFIRGHNGRRFLPDLEPT